MSEIIRVNISEETVRVGVVEEVIRVTGVAAAGPPGVDGNDGEGLPAGGTTGQVPTKQSNADGDIEWETPPTAEVTAQDLQDEADARVTGDASLDGRLDTIEALGPLATAASVTNEANTRSAADGTLQGNINTEASARSSADTTLQTNINTEASTRASQDLLLVPLTQKAAAGGVATLGGDGKIPSSQIPSVPVSDFLGVVASEAAMLALDGDPGDFCVRSDVSGGTQFILFALPETDVDNWLSTGSSDVVSVNGEVGAVSLIAADIPFTPVGSIAATQSQAAIAEVASDAASDHSTAMSAAAAAASDAATVSTGLGNHLTDTTAAHAASAVSVNPSGLIIVASTNVQAALAELDAATDDVITTVAAFKPVSSGVGVDVDSSGANIVINAAVNNDDTMADASYTETVFQGNVVAYVAARAGRKPLVSILSGDATSSVDATTIVDTGLTLTTEANVYYEVSGLIIYSASQQADLRFLWTVPGTPVGYYSMHGLATTATGVGGGLNTFGATPWGTVFTAGGPVAADNTTLVTVALFGTFKSNAAGTFKLRYRQNTLDAGFPTIVRAQSRLQLQAVA